MAGVGVFSPWERRCDEPYLALRLERKATFGQRV